MDPHRPNSHTDANKRLAEHYSTLLKQHGDSPLTAQWGTDPAVRERRFEALAQVGIPVTAKILDFGCGLGDALPYLRTHHGFTGDYVGYDLSEDIVAHARAKYAGDPKARFEVRDIFTTPPEEEFDFVWICGTFNIKTANSDAYIRDALRILYAKTRKGMTFNLMSTYVDFFDPTLYYADPDLVFRFCKEELSPCVALRHDYMLKAGVTPYEFAVYIHRTPVAPRKNRAATYFGSLPSSSM